MQNNNFIPLNILPLWFFASSYEAIVFDSRLQRSEKGKQAITIKCIIMQRAHIRQRKVSPSSQ